MPSLFPYTYKILACGDRNWQSHHIVRKALQEVTKGKSNVKVIHGAARGADTIAGQEAEKLGFTVQAFPAQWERYGRAAGPVRNSLMLEQHPDVVVSFHNDLLASKGTKDMCHKALRAGVHVIVVGHESSFVLTRGMGV